VKTDVVPRAIERLLNVLGEVMFGAA